MNPWLWIHQTPNQRRLTFLFTFPFGVWNRTNLETFLRDFMRFPAFTLSEQYSHVVINWLEGLEGFLCWWLMIINGFIGGIGYCRTLHPGTYIYTVLNLTIKIKNAFVTSPRSYLSSKVNMYLFFIKMRCNGMTTHKAPVIAQNTWQYITIAWWKYMSCN